MFVDVLLNCKYGPKAGRAMKIKGIIMDIDDIFVNISFLVFHLIQSWTCLIIVLSH